MREKKGGLSDLLGSRFEAVLKCAFPKITGLEKSSDHNPDFIFESMFGKLLIEAKTAYGGHHYNPTTGSIFLAPRPGKAYGAQIKEFQVDAFDEKATAGTSVVYAIGYHGVYQSQKRIGVIQTVSSRKRFINRNFISPSVYFLSQSIVKCFFDEEKRLSDKAKANLMAGKPLPKNDPGWYASLKPTHIRQICDAVLLDESFYSFIKRDNIGVELFTHYGLDRESLVAKPLGFTQTTFAFKTKRGLVPIQIGYVVEKKQEMQVLDLLYGNSTL